MLIYHRIKLTFIKSGDILYVWMMSAVKEVKEFPIEISSNM